MYTHARELFGVDESRETADLAEGAAPASAGLTEVNTALRIAPEAGDAGGNFSPPSPGQKPHTVNRSQGAPVSPPYATAPSQESLLSASSLRPQTAPRVRPTCELPPSKQSDVVQHSEPAAVMLEEDVYHNSCFTRSQVEISPVQELTSFSYKSSRVLRTVQDPGASPTGRGSTRDQVSHFCSICGIAVQLVGCMTEHQRQWQNHLNCEAHQRALHVWAAARNGNTAPLSMIGINMSTSPPASPSFSRLIDAFVMSPETLTLEEANLSAAATPPKATHEAGQRPHPQTRHATTTTATREKAAAFTPPPATTAEVQKELVYPSSQPSSSEEETHRATHTTESREHTHPSSSEVAMPPVGYEAETGRLPPRRPGVPKTHSQSTTHAMSIEELIRQKERGMERTLQRYLAAKERNDLLTCLRHWFNLMFTRVVGMNTKPSRHHSAVLPGEHCDNGGGAHASHSAQAPSAPSGTTNDRPERGNVGVKPKSHSGSATSVGEKKQARELVAPSTRPRMVFVSQQPPRDELFMSSQTKDFAHVKMGSSSSSSIEMEVAKTDVSWFIQRGPNTSAAAAAAASASASSTASTSTSAAAESHARGEINEETLESSVYACSLAGEKSVEAMLSALSPRLQRRVRAVMRGERFHLSAFPKTSELLLSMRSSSLVSTTPPPPSNPGDRPSASSSATRDTRHASEGTTGHQKSSSASHAEEREMPTRAEETPRVASERCVRSPSSAMASARAGSGPQTPLVEIPFPRSPEPDETPRAAPNDVRCAPRLSPAARGAEGSYTTTTTHSTPRRARHRPPLGIPGAYYVYLDGAYRRVGNPASPSHTDAHGRRLPLYVVRHRAASPTPSPRRARTPPTRPRSPLGPGRLNPYCAACVARFRLILVDEEMRPVTPRVGQRGCGDCGERHRDVSALLEVPPSVDGAGGTLESKAEEEEVRRQERRLRRRMRALLRRGLPEGRGTHDWEEYLTALRDALRSLEVLRAERTVGNYA